MNILGAQASYNVPRPAGTDTSNRELQFIFSPLIQCDDQLLNRGYFHRYFAFMGNWERGGLPMINSNSLLTNSLVSLS